jgi:hypothetical protein
MRFPFSTTILALALVAAAPVLAASSGNVVAPQTDMTAKEFLTYHDKLERNLGSKQYDYVNAANRARIAREQDAIRKSLSGHQSLDELDAASRAQVLQSHENVLAIMDDAELDKVTCKREHKMGSRMGRTVCISARERQQQADMARETITRNRTCTGAECSGG